MTLRKHLGLARRTVIIGLAHRLLGRRHFQRQPPALVHQRLQLLVQFIDAQAQFRKLILTHDRHASCRLVHS